MERVAARSMVYHTKNLQVEKLNACEAQCLEFLIPPLDKPALLCYVSVLYLRTLTAHIIEEKEPIPVLFSFYGVAQDNTCICVHKNKDYPVSIHIFLRR